MTLRNARCNDKDGDFRFALLKNRTATRISTILKLHMTSNFVNIPITCSDSVVIAVQHVALGSRMHTLSKV